MKQISNEERAGLIILGVIAKHMNYARGYAEDKMVENSAAGKGDYWRGQRDAYDAILDALDKTVEDFLDKQDNA